jgi:enoyl-CoA hydratase/carnithine racemase
MRRMGDMMDQKVAVRPELVERLSALVHEMGASPDELEAAAQEVAEFNRWVEAECAEAEAELAAGAPTRDAEEVLAEFLERVEQRIRAARS